MVRCICALLLVAGVAEARHTAKTPITDYSAYTLNQWEWRVGPFRNGVGLLDSLTVDFIPLLTAFRIANLRGKWRVWDNPRWAVAVQAGFIRFDSSRFREPDEGQDPLIVTAFPLDLVASYRTERSTWSVALSGSPVEASGTLSSDEAEGGAVGAYSSASLYGSWEWRWTEVTALVVETRLKLNEQLTGDVVTTIPVEDGTLQVTTRGGSEVEGFKGQLVVSGHWSFDSLNVRAGLGYGNWLFPGTTTFLPEWAVGPMIVPELDLYWRF